MNSSLLVSERRLRANFRAFRALATSKILQVVKANAYGHGIEFVVKTLLSEAVDAFGVVNVDEGRVVRRCSSTVPIFILGVVPIRDFSAAIASEFVIPAWRLDQVAQASQIAVANRTTAKLQIKVDTGMGRLGLMPGEVNEFLKEVRHTPNVRFVSIYTHFLNADDLSSSRYKTQLEVFMSCVSAAKAELGSDMIVHAANSPAVLRDKASHFDMVRLGIALYGISPDPKIQLPLGVAPVGKWISTLENIKSVPKGHGISYGGEFVAETEMKVGIIPVGYADGFRRVPKGVNAVAIRGQLARVLGRVCMDHCVIDLSFIDSPRIGDEVILLGSDSLIDLSASKLAERWGTNEYDVLSGIGNRVARALDD